MKNIHSVLIVDDNPDDVEIAKYYLEESGRYHHVLSVSDGKEALELFRDYEQSHQRFPEEFPPLLVLLDINMPRLGGFEFLEAYTRLNREGDDPVVVVMLSSSKHSRDIEQANQYDLVKDFVVKPLSREEATRLADTYGEP